MNSLWIERVNFVIVLPADKIIRYFNLTVFHRNYSEMLTSIDDDQKNTLEFIINQEKSHMKLLESLIDFISNPKVWLENSEWNHLDTY